MREVRTNKTGQILSSEVQNFGGEFSLWEKLRNKGVGSTKVIYDEGIEVFDALDRGIAGEISFVSFELLKNGLLLRLNQNQRQLCLGVKLSKIETIKLTGFRIEIKDRKPYKVRTKIVHRGVLEIKEKGGIETSFSVVTREFNSIKSFFKKPIFDDLFKFQISTDPPEKDHRDLLNLLEDLL